MTRVQKAVLAGLDAYIRDYVNVKDDKPPRLFVSAAYMGVLRELNITDTYQGIPIVCEGYNGAQVRGI